MKEDTKSKMQTISEYIAEKRWIFFGTIILIIVTSVGVISWQLIDSSLDTKSQTIAEELQTSWIEYTKAQTTKDTMPNKLINRRNELGKLVEKYDETYPTRYSGYRVAIIKVKLALEDEKNEEAALILEQCGKINNHPLAAQMLIEAAVQYENIEDVDKAYEIYKLAYSKFKSSMTKDRIIFNLGRLSEARDEAETARSYYNQIAEEAFDSSSSDFAKMAKSRLLKMDADFNREDEINE